MKGTDAGGNFPEEHQKREPEQPDRQPYGEGRWVTPPDWELGRSRRPEEPMSGTPYSQFPPVPAETLPVKKRNFIHKLLRDVVVPIVVAFTVAMVFQAAVAKPYQIPTGSMKPTINEYDRILADRLIYHFRSIQRGDIIVFNPPSTLESDTPFVKRVIGLPGDTVEIRNGKVFVNGEEYVVPSAQPTSYTMPAEKVPPDQLFVLGDNRNDSFDSHRWGFVPIDNVIGRVEVIYWPIAHFRILSNDF
jgi:signal peptidase I